MPLGITGYLLFYNNIYRYNTKKERRNEHGRINYDIDVIANLTITSFLLQKRFLFHKKLLKREKKKKNVTTTKNI
jgi:hypothetical protein